MLFDGVAHQHLSLRRRYSFFATIYFRTACSKLKSAYTCFSQRTLTYAMSPTDTIMPTPISASLRIPMICLSVNLERRMWSLLRLEL